MYKYFVFLSYTREHTAQWVKNAFLPSFTKYLSPYKISLDTSDAFFPLFDGMENTHKWATEFATALSYSKILVPVLSGDYFTLAGVHACCLMLYRERQTSRDLVFPIQLFDGMVYPSFLKKRCIDFRRLNNSNEALLMSERYNILDGLIQDWVDDRLAPAFEASPDWSGEWCQEHWTQAAEATYFHELKPRKVGPIDPWPR